MGLIVILYLKLYKCTKIFYYLYALEHSNFVQMYVTVKSRCDRAHKVYLYILDQICELFMSVCLSERRDLRYYKSLRHKTKQEDTEIL